MSRFPSDDDLADADRRKAGREWLVRSWNLWTSRFDLWRRVGDRMELVDDDWQQLPGTMLKALRPTRRKAA